MKKIVLFINEYPEYTTILIGLIGCLIIGVAYDNLESMIKVVLGAIVFGIVIGLISFLIKTFF